MLGVAYQEECHWRLGCREPTWMEEVSSILEKDGRAQAVFLGQRKARSTGLSKTVRSGRQR